jgi:hypothetical protein
MHSNTLDTLWQLIFLTSDNHISYLRTCHKLIDAHHWYTFYNTIKPIRLVVSYLPLKYEDSSLSLCIMLSKRVLHIRYLRRSMTGVHTIIIKVVIPQLDEDMAIWSSISHELDEDIVCVSREWKWVGMSDLSSNRGGIYRVGDKISFFGGFFRALTIKG